jgi:hypothetical protein
MSLIPSVEKTEGEKRKRKEKKRKEMCIKTR